MLLSDIVDTSNEDYDFYTDPFTTNRPDPEFQSLLKNLGISKPSAAGQDLKTTSGSYISDPTLYQGKLVRFARYYIENVEVQQYSGMAGFQDFYENGQLMGFTITANDSSMIPACFVENAVRSRDVVNDLSFLDSVIHGRGMTHSEATSTFKQNGLDTSRDVSGQQLSLFPYITRYKDTVTGSSSNYDDYKGTVDDKCYVMNFEPTVYVPYQRLYFDVVNNSVDGARLVNRLEIKRMVFLDQSANAGAQDMSTEFTDFNSALAAIKTQINNPSTAMPSPPPPIPQQQTSQSFNATAVTANIYDEFIRYLQNKGNTTKVRSKAPRKKIIVDNLSEQKERAALAKRINGLSTAADDNDKDTDNTLRMKLG